jgi:hypothetical protein
MEQNKTLPIWYLSLVNILLFIRFPNLWHIIAIVYLIIFLIQVYRVDTPQKWGHFYACLSLHTIYSFLVTMYYGNKTGFNYFAEYIYSALLFRCLLLLAVVSFFVAASRKNLE